MMFRGGLLSYLKKEELAEMVTRCHQLSFVVTRCYSLNHSLSLVVRLVVIRCHSLSLVVPLAVTRCHSLYHLSVLKFDCERKRTFFYLFFLSIATLKSKDSYFLCQLCFLSLYLFWLTACIFHFFYLAIHAKIMN